MQVVTSNDITSLLEVGVALNLAFGLIRGLYDLKRVKLQSYLKEYENHVDLISEDIDDEEEVERLKSLKNQFILNLKLARNSSERHIRKFSIASILAAIIGVALIVFASFFPNYHLYVWQIWVIVLTMVGPVPIFSFLSWLIGMKAYKQAESSRERLKVALEHAASHQSVK